METFRCVLATCTRRQDCGFSKIMKILYTLGGFSVDFVDGLDDGCCCVRPGKLSFFHGDILRALEPRNNRSFQVMKLKEIQTKHPIFNLVLLLGIEEYSSARAGFDCQYSRGTGKE